MNFEEKTIIIESIINPVLIPIGFKYESFSADGDGNGWEYTRECDGGGNEDILIIDKFRYADVKFSIDAGYTSINIGFIKMNKSIHISPAEVMGLDYSNEEDFKKVITNFKDSIVDYGLTYLKEMNEKHKREKR